MLCHQVALCVAHEHADAPQLAGLLRARRERPRRSAAEQRDELAAFQMVDLHSVPASQGRMQDIELVRSRQEVLATGRHPRRNEIIQQLVERVHEARVSILRPRFMNSLCL